MTKRYEEQLRHVAMTDLPWEKMTGKNVLITGATGLIGGCLVDVLMHRPNKDFKIYAAGRNEARAKERFAAYWHEDDFCFLSFDVVNEVPFDIDFHFIIDAASGASPSLYATDPVGVMQANIMGVNQLLTYGLHHHLEKFVYVSSGEIYGEGVGQMFSETDSGYIDCATVRACYPSSKRAAETLCVSYAAQYGLDISIARPSHVYGAYFSATDMRVYAQFIRNVLHKEDIVMKSNGEQFRSWCYVMDCVAGLLFILLKGKNQCAYNIADPQSNVSIRTLAELIAKIGCQRVVIELPPEVEKAGYSVISKATFSTSRLESLGWRIEGTMEEKLRFTVEEMQTQNRE